MPVSTSSSPRRSARRREDAQRSSQRLQLLRPQPDGGWVPDPPDRPRHVADGPPGPDLVRDSWRARLADRLPAAIRRARWSVPVTAAVALLAICGLASLAFAVRTASASPGVPVPARAAPAGSAAPSPSAFGSPASSPAPAAARTEGGEVVVHVVGQVARPGLVRLPSGSRVDDALAAAGGATPEADLTRVNLARVLVDGEQVAVPRPGEALPASSGAGGGAGPGSTGSADAPAAPVNLNTASLSDLDGLPGIGPVLAQRILDWRQANGRFSSADELGEVAGIGDTLLERLRPLVRV